MMRNKSENEIPMDRVIVIAHCMRCDTYIYDAFLEWLYILQVGNKVQISDTKPLLNIENIQHHLDCFNCIKEEYYSTVTVVVFEWAQNEG